MSIPTPPIDLVNHCSAIFNSVLYVYSPQGFVSLALEQDAKWQTLDSGAAVTGGLCVPALVSGSEALYIVGGTTGAAGALDSYSGLQRYDLNTNTWETLTPTVAITQNRVKHGAAFVGSLNSIVVYAGTQDAGASGLGQQTFAISTAPPYEVTSFTSQGAPALSSPMVMPWSNDQIVLIGGAADNTQVWLFGLPQGWTNLGTTLPAGLGLDTPTKQCTIVTGDDSSKVLEVYDFGASPNAVTRYALLVDGAPAPVNQQVAPPDASTKRRRSMRRRDLTIANWPKYNSTLAPTSTRSGFSLAVDTNGLVVVSGGGGDEPIAIFDQATNTWMNSTSFFVKEQVPLSAPTSSSSSSSAAASSTLAPSSSIPSSAPTSSSTSTGVLGTGQPKSKVLTTLGATLGAVFGLAAILIIILLLLRWKKMQRKKAAGGVNEKDQDRMSFADQGADFMKEAGGARGRAYSQTKTGNTSLTSLQIFQNKSMGHRRSMPSDSSQVPLAKSKSPLGVSDPLEMSQMSQRSSPTFTTRSIDLEKPGISPPKRVELTPAAAIPTKDAKDGRTRSNGWSRYFANNDVTNLASMQGGNRNTYNTERSGVSKSSEYDDSRQMSQGSTIPPLELNLGPKFESQRLSAVNTGSPTMGRSHDDIQQGLSAEIRRAGSTSSRGSDTGFDLSGNPTPATQTTWTSASISRDRQADTRSISSAYSGSNPFFGSTSDLDPRPRKGSSGAPALPQLNLRNYGDASRDSQGSAITVFPSGLDSPKAHAFPSRSQNQGPGEYFPAPPNIFSNRPRDSGATDVTVFPGAPASTPSSNFGVPSVVQPGSRNGPHARKVSKTEDLGWLNLNAGKAG
jgi:hypothetical protein